MTDFWKSDTYLIVKAMKATGNRAGIIQEWKNAVEDWALTATGPDAEAVRAWLPLWQVRPFYTAAELAPIFPVLSLALGYTPRPAAQKSANRLANELDFAGLPRVNSKVGLLGDFERYKDFFIVERIHFWSARHVGQEDFENALR